MQDALHAVRRLSHQLDVIPEASGSSSGGAGVGTAGAAAASPLEPAGGGPLAGVAPPLSAATQERGRDGTQGLLQDVDDLSPIHHLSMVWDV